MESSSGGGNNKYKEENTTGKSSSSSLSLSRKFSGATVSPRKGVQKFYTKIRHKIEDSMPPKISAKLNKTNATTMKNSLSEQTKPTPPPRASSANKKRKQLTMLTNDDQTDINFDNRTMDNYNKTRDILKSPSCENMKISNNPNGGVIDDSDEECQMSLNESTLSLEDEIFEELEKVAHDEAKLNAVLKNFDKILADFTGPTNTKMTTSTPALKSYNNDNLTSINPDTIAIKDTKTATEIQQINTKFEVKTSPSHKQLQKSKTCSIIESRCILKKSISDPPQIDDEEHIEAVSISNDLQHFAALQVTKSLWNLQDFETFAKSGKKFEKLNCRLPVLKTSSGNYKLGKSLSNPTTPLNNINNKSKSMKQINKISSLDGSNRLRSQLPRATSVWEVSTSISSLNSHPLCTRTSSGSKIPVKKISPQRLVYSGRSNSFCDQTSNNSIKLTTAINSTSSVYLSKMNKTLTASTLSSSLSSPTKIIQVGKVLPTPKRNPVPAKTTTTVNKIIKNLNELSNSGSGDIIKKSEITKKPGSTISIVSSNAISAATTTVTAIKSTNNISNSVNKRYNQRLINSASSTPHSLNKVGIAVKTSTTTFSSATRASLSSPGATLTIKTPLKSANSELSLNNLKFVRGASNNRIHNVTTYNRKSPQQSDLLLNKCLEKGHEILKKVEAFGSVTKLEHYNEYSKSGSQMQRIQLSANRRFKEPKNEMPSLPSFKNNITSTTLNSTTTLTSQNQQKKFNSQNKINQQTIKKDRDTSFSKLAYNKDDTLKKNSVDTVDSCLLPASKLQKSLPQIFYAKECTIQYPRLESCKIIPPLLCHPSQQHAELLVNVKSTQQPLRVHQDSMLCINSDIIRSEKDYHSDCSDDSGHISNENDEVNTPIPTDDNYDKTSKTLINNNKCTNLNSITINNNNNNNNNNGDAFIKSQKGVKISELLEKFETASKESSLLSTLTPLDTSALTTTSSTSLLSSSTSSSSSSSSSFQKEENYINKQKCTTVKIAEVKPVKCITSSMEIFPTYSSEVIIHIQ